MVVPPGVCGDGRENAQQVLVHQKVGWFEFTNGHEYKCTYKLSTRVPIQTPIELIYYYGEVV